MNRKNILKSNRSGFAPTDKIIVLVLVVLVILLILYFIFRGNITDYLRNLPGYSYNTTDRVIDDIDEKIEVECKEPYPVLAGYVKMDNGNFNFLGLDKKETRIYSEGRVIELSKSGIDPNLGEINQGNLITIDKSFIVGKNYWKYRYDNAETSSTYPSRELLMGFDNSIFNPKLQLSLICRKDKIVVSPFSATFTLKDKEYGVIIFRYKFDKPLWEYRQPNIKSDLDIGKTLFADVYQTDLSSPNWNNKEGEKFIFSLYGKSYEQGIDWISGRTEKGASFKVEVKDYSGTFVSTFSKTFTKDNIQELEPLKKDLIGS